MNHHVTPVNHNMSSMVIYGHIEGLYSPAQEKKEAFDDLFRAFFWFILSVRLSNGVARVICRLASFLWEPLRAAVSVFVWWPADSVCCCRLLEGTELRFLPHTEYKHSATHKHTNARSCSVFFVVPASQPHTCIRFPLLHTHTLATSKHQSPSVSLSSFFFSSQVFLHRFILPRLQLCYTAKKYTVSSSGPAINIPAHPGLLGLLLFL